MSDSPVLQASLLTRHYGEVTVLKDVDLNLFRGEVHALIGANGAGKSTLCRILAGLVPKSSGQITINGKTFNPNSKRDAELAGIEIVQQELNLVSTLTVAENLMLTRLPSRLGVIRRGVLNAEARKLLHAVGLDDVSPDALAGTLGVGQQQMIEIAAALGRDCQILILDEPTAALSHREVDLLFHQIERLQAHGTNIIYISHRLDEIKAIADRITILRDGQAVTTASAEHLSIDEMIRLMSGEAQSVGVEHKSKGAGACNDANSERVALRVEGLCAGFVRGVSFSVNEGQILGITGLVGAGRTELLRAIFGADVADAGYVYVNNDSKGYRFRTPAEAVSHGLALVTEDRKESGLLLPTAIDQNVTLASLWKRFHTSGLINFQGEQKASTMANSRLDVRCNSTSQPVGELSGGNQQKVVIAKWLERGAYVFLLDEPTRGVDVAARRKIYEVIRSLAREGKAIIIVSSDLDELFETCDRIAVMSAGRLVRSFDQSEWNRDAILEAAFEGHRDTSLR